MPAPRNRTLSLSAEEEELYRGRLISLDKKVNLKSIIDKTICQDLLQIISFLPNAAFDLIFADPPYNLSKNFGAVRFNQQSQAAYQQWLHTWLPAMARLLKPSGSIYVCGDWRSAGALEQVLQQHFIIHNRITWEREKGRAAKNNWKNSHEDIWFASQGPDYKFYGERVKITRRVLAPYRDAQNKPKDWQAQASGTRLRQTGSSNLWTDITVPFWSMSENTDHPTQKPEKLLAKVILASSQPGDVVFDPFAGAGTTQVVAKKLGRHYVGVEINLRYCLYAEKRLHLAENDKRIQGYENGVFWERNSRQIV